MTNHQFSSRDFQDLVPAPNHPEDWMGELLPVTNPVNPILVAFRTEFEGYDLADVADSIQEWADNMHVMLAFASNPDQIEHARKVLTRLAHLAGQE